MGILVSIQYEDYESSYNNTVLSEFVWKSQPWRLVRKSGSMLYLGGMEVKEACFKWCNCNQWGMRHLMNSMSVGSMSVQHSLTFHCSILPPTYACSPSKHGLQLSISRPGPQSFSLAFECVADAWCDAFQPYLEESLCYILMGVILTLLNNLSR